MSCSRMQHNDASETRTHGLSVLSQALYHWVTQLPDLTFCILMNFSYILIQNASYWLVCCLKDDR